MIIANYDSVRFIMDGQLYPKTYRARTYGADKIVLVHIISGNEEVNPVNYTDIEIDGAVHPSQLSAVNALNLIY